MAKAKKKPAEVEQIEKALDAVENEMIKKEKEENQKMEELDKEVESNLESKIKEVEKQMEKLQDEIGKANGNPVRQKQGFIRTVSLKSPIPMYQLPEDIQQYLKNMCFWTNVYLMDKEWLEKHNADMNMIKKLKDFISEHFN